MPPALSSARSARSLDSAVVRLSACQRQGLRKPRGGCLWLDPMQPDGLNISGAGEALKAFGEMDSPAGFGQVKSWHAPRTDWCPCGCLFRHHPKGCALVSGHPPQIGPNVLPPQPEAKSTPSACQTLPKPMLQQRGRRHQHNT